ncbi:hypothetical protein Tco_0819938 [Tanacetum coccineum]|uniref:Uncharacterized protein n=1 Tax=Tanacetum coccineum TaxID=301880 RepID=A0ABQ5AC99_9ASTR
MISNVLQELLPEEVGSMENLEELLFGFRYKLAFESTPESSNFHTFTGKGVSPKCDALNHRLTIGIPGNHVPIWDWHSQYAFSRVIFKIVNKEKVIPMSEAHIEGDLVMTIMRTDGTQSVRRGAHIVYKKDMESVQESKTWISDYGNLLQVDGGDYQEHPDYDTIVSGFFFKRQR